MSWAVEPSSKLTTLVLKFQFRNRDSRIRSSDQRQSFDDERQSSKIQVAFDIIEPTITKTNPSTKLGVLLKQSNNFMSVSVSKVF